MKKLVSLLPRTLRTFMSAVNGSFFWVSASLNEKILVWLSVFRSATA